MRGLDLVGALDVLLADVEQADARPVDTVQVGGDHRAHHRELHELFGRAVGIGAEVEHHGVAVRGRHGGDDCRAIDAGHHAEHVARGREQRAGVAGGHARSRLAFLDEVDRDAHRGVFLATHGVLRTLVHRHHLARLDHGAARGIGRRDQRAHDFAAADDDQPQVGGLGEDVEGGGNRHPGTVVAAHGVHGNGEPGGHARARPDVIPGLPRPPASRSPSCRGRNRQA